MLSFKELSEKKTKVTINPKLDDLKEKAKLSDHGEDCDCMKCEKKRRGEEVDDGPDVANESAVPGKPAERLKTDRNMFSIPKDEREAAAERLKAKAAAKRKANLKKEEAYVSQEEVSEESDQSIEKEETSSLLKFEDFVSALNDLNEGRAEDAKKSLDAVKKRQDVLDAHEKKTGKKLDITKTPEHKAHKKNFPGAKRTGKKVKGAKETPQETQNRRINRATERIVKKGYTSKEKKEVKAMAKHASRFD
tara:strand:+ start:456 stop:1202 length:747 start_codon:yes stop_codon:yes gene_type:complete